MASGRGFAVFVDIGAKLLPSLNSSVATVEKRFAKMGRAVRVELAEMKLAARQFTSAMKPLAAMAAAGGLTIGLKGMLGEGAEFQHQVAQMRIMGRTSKEMADAVAAAKRTMTDVPTSSLNDSLKILNETTLAFGGLNHAIENLSFNSKMGALMKGILGDDYDEAAGFNKLVRALELRGGKLSAADYQRQASALFRAISVSGGTVNPDELLGFMQQAGPAARGFSERFLTRVVPSLIQEFGGERAGTMSTALYNQFNGRVPIGGKALTAEWVRLGLVPPNGTGGNISRTGWSPGSLKGYALATSDPLAWIEQVMMPALRTKGIDTNNAGAMRLEVQKLFGRETAKRLADTLFNPAQLARINADRALYDKAMGVDKAYSYALYNDPRMAQMAAANSLKNLETNLGKTLFSPEMQRAMVNFARAVNRLAGWFDRHPGLAKASTGTVGLAAGGAIAALFGAGGLVKGLFKGFGRLLGFVLVEGGTLALNLFTAFFRTGLGRMLVGALVRLAPLILEGLGAAFALLSNPIGWAIILAGVAAALVYYFRDDLARAWPKVVAWFRGAWQGVKDYVLSINWRGVGMAIADALTFGLASKITPSRWGAIVKGASIGLAGGGGVGMVAGAVVGAVAGKRALGGPIRPGQWYRVNERGEEHFMSTRPGVIIPNGRRAVGGGAGGGVNATFNIYDAHDPESVARQVERYLARLARQQDALLSD